MIYLSLFIVYAIGTYAVLDPFIAFWLVAGMCSFWLAMQAQTWKGKSAGFYCWESPAAWGDDQRFSRPCRAGIKRASMGCNAKRWKDLFIYGWLAVISCVLTVLPQGTGDSAAGA